MNLLTGTEQFWVELLKGLGLPDSNVMRLEIEIGPGIGTPPIVRLETFDPATGIPKGTEEHRIALRDKTRGEPGFELLQVLRARLVLPLHIVSLRIVARSNSFVVATIDAELEPTTSDPVTVDGEHVRQALGKFETEPIF